VLNCRCLTALSLESEWEEAVAQQRLRLHGYDKTERREAASVLDGRRPFAGSHRGLRRRKDAAHRCTEFDAPRSREGRRLVLCRHSFSADLTPIDDERNVNPFVNGDWSPHSTFGLRSAWSLLRARRSQSTSMKHPITGTVEEGRSRRETA